MRTRSENGQNFLTDATAAHRIVDAAGDISHTAVVEIGPGRGAITHILAARASRLIAIELDRVLAAELRARYSANSKVEIVEQDVLTVDFAALARAPQEKFAIVGNLPYYITSDILLHLFAAHNVISRAVVMVQREVAERIAATPGSSDYGLLSATAQLYCSVEKLFTLPPGAFSPPPEVHSTVLRLKMAPRFEELRVEPEPFIHFLRQSFAQKRKTLANNLRAAGYSSIQIGAALTRDGIAPLTRAEELPLATAAALFRGLTCDGDQAANKKLPRS